MRDVLDKHTRFDELPAVVERFVQMGLDDARASLKAELSQLSPEKRAEQFAKIETKLREVNTEAVHKAWLQLHQGEERVQ